MPFSVSPKRVIDADRLDKKELEEVKSNAANLSLMEKVRNAYFVGHKTPPIIAAELGITVHQVNRYILQFTNQSRSYGAASLDEQVGVSLAKLQSLTHITYSQYESQLNRMGMGDPKLLTILAGLVKQEADLLALSKRVDRKAADDAATISSIDSLLDELESVSESSLSSNWEDEKDD